MWKKLATVINSIECRYISKHIYHTINNTYYIMIQESVENIRAKVQEIQKLMEAFKIDLNVGTAYMLGLTGSGKSSLISYLLGAIPTWEKISGRYCMTNPTGMGLPQIGNTSVSCTVIPATYRDTAANLVYVDPPGFLDTKGPDQETLNSYANARMFIRGVKTKIVLVVQYSTLESGRGGLLADVATRLYQLFPYDFTTLVNSIVIVVSKVILGEFEESDIVDAIVKINESNNNMLPECKMMIRTVIQRGNILVFPIPKKIDDQRITRLKTHIQQLPTTILSANATISLSPAAKMMLDDLARKITHQIGNCAKQIRLQIENKFINISVSDWQIKKLLNILLNEMDGGLSVSFENFASSIQLSSELVSQITDSLTQMQFCRTLHAEVHTNTTLLESVANTLREAINSLDNKLQKMVTKEELDAMNRRHEQSMQRRHEEFQQFTQQMAADAQARQERARQDLDAQRQSMQRLMQDSSRQHQQQIAILQKQLTAIQNRPPQVIHQKKGWCSIM